MKGRGPRDLLIAIGKPTDDMEDEDEMEMGEPSSPDSYTAWRKSLMDKSVSDDESYAMFETMLSECVGMDEE